MAFIAASPLQGVRSPALSHRRGAQCTTRMSVSGNSGEPVRLPRRAFLALGALLALPASARAGLQEFPAREPFGNDYYLVRAGETVSMAVENVARTNPVEKTSIRLHGLTKRGIEQSMAVASVLDESFGLGPSCWIWASQNTSCQETATIIAKTLRVRQEQLVPEFAFLDARGFGALEGSPLPAVEQTIAQVDLENPDARPPPGEDGTPNESVADVFVRVRQLMSKLETQYFGEEIVIVAPDSDTLSILQAAMCDVPLNLHREKFHFRPGEMRKVEPVVVGRA